MSHRKAKISNLDGLMIAKEVFRLQISVEVVVFVHVSQALESLEHYVSDLVFTEQFSTVLHQLVDIDVEVFKNKVENVLV